MEHLYISFEQCAQKCPECDLYFWEADETLMFGRWMVHEHCYPHHLQPRSIPVNSERVSERIRTLSEHFRQPLEAFSEFNHPGACRICRTLNFLNAAYSCSVCWAAHVEIDIDDK